MNDDNATANNTSLQPLGLASNEGLGLAVNRALFADECQRLAEWALIGPVQRAALESFAERLLAAERDRIRDLCSIDMAQATLKASELAQSAERERCAQVCDRLGHSVLAWVAGVEIRKGPNVRGKL